MLWKISKYHHPYPGPWRFDFSVPLDFLPSSGRKEEDKSREVNFPGGLGWIIKVTFKTKPKLSFQNQNKKKRKKEEKKVPKYVRFSFFFFFFFSFFGLEVECEYV